MASADYALTPYRDFATVNLMIFEANQVAVVTGASSGVGKAIALALAQQGASLALVGRDLGVLQQIAPDGPGKVRCYEADLTDDAELARFTKQVIADFGHVDVLVHSAGVFAMGKLETAPLAEFDLQYRCNVRAPYALTQLLLPKLIEHQGQIVFINSTAGLNAGAGVSQYAATKHALKAVADSLRQEINPRGVRVLSVFLGRTATPMQEAICKQEGKPYDPAYFIQPADVAATLVHTLGLPRNAEIIDLTIRPMKSPPAAK
ncbi:MAG: SDR family oxidoreductase [Luteolibacter sp.]|uniref:SDR family oxidoreductase n=1 Tax=Luteolibacter sp. TaxID=1962973 RepID=UPI003263094F